MVEDDIAEIITRAQRGDEAALSRLYEQYRVSIYRYLFYRVGDSPAAEDLTSEVFLRVLQAFPAFRMQRISFQAWLFRIARNLSIDYYRRHGNRNVPLEDTLPDTSQNVPNRVDHKLTSDTFRYALRQLSDEQRDVIIMRFVARMPIREVAQSLKKSEDAIKGLQRRGLSTLKDILADQEVFNV